MRIYGLMSVSAFCSISALTACGGDVVSPATNPGVPDGGALPDATPQADAADPPDTSPPLPFPAFKIDAPQVVTAGGPTMATPKLIPVYFANDDKTFTAQITNFVNQLPASAYWPPPTTEYSVGIPTTADPVQLSEAATANLTDAQIQTWLAGKLNANDPAFPAADANSLYLLYYPTGTTITEGNGKSCQSFGGYHSNLTLDKNHGSKDVAYAVMPRCATFGNLKGIDVITGTSSHEIIEAASDPFPQTNPAYAQVDANHIAWMFFLGGGENSDLCAQFPGAFYKPSDLPFTVQRSWSNITAKAGHDPCVPAMTGPYFNTMPELKDTLSIGGQFTTKGVKIPVGQTAVVQLKLFSDVETGAPWTVNVVDAAALQGAPANLQLTLDKNSGRNGDIINLTIKVLSKNEFGAEGFLVESQLGNRTTLWIGLVGN